MKYYYSDKDTEQLIESTKKRVYLYGGFGGYNNFGDIIQLKNTLWFYRQHTDIEPIILLHAAALEDPQHVAKFKRWFDCEYILFIADKYVDASEAGLAPIKKINTNGILHVYGGGFLNKYWGKGMIDKIHDMILTLEPAEYIFSGQQIEEATVPLLKEMFEAVGLPSLFGVRDMESFQYMKQAVSTDRLYFSFDDVTEIFETWRDNTKLSHKVRIINRMRPKSTMWHINMSSYASVNKARVLNKIRKAKKAFPQNRVLLAHIYNDIRSSLKDTLQSVIQLENDFPYHEYKVVNLAQMALDLHVERGVYPGIGGILSNVDLAVASSYHITMFAHFFGIPAYLMADNEFYKQKQKGLGLEVDFQKFLQNPTINLKSYDQEKARRKKWISLLIAHLQKSSKKMEIKKIKTIRYDAEEKPAELVYRDYKG